MTAKELVNYITSKMSAKQALLKLMESSLVQYENLKFDKSKEVHPIIIISMASLDLGWNMIVVESEDEIEGLLIGTDEYIKRNLKK